MIKARLTCSNLVAYKIITLTAVVSAGSLSKVAADFARLMQIQKNAPSHSERGNFFQVG
jgi:hypothetical protein